MSIGLQFGSVIDYPCPSDETLAAYIDDVLLNAQCIRVNDHLNYCPRCYELVSETRVVLQMVQRDEAAAQREVREEYEKELDTAIRKRLDELETELPHLVECEQWRWLRTRTQARTHDD